MKNKPTIQLTAKDGTKIPVVISEDYDPPKDSPARKSIEGGILERGPVIISKAIAEADVVRMNPDDPNDEGEVIGKVGDLTNEQAAALLAGATEEWVRVGDTLVVPPNPDGRAFMQNADADLLTAQLRAEMTNLSTDLLDGVPPEEANPVLAWIHDSRIENFREWLFDRNGWAKLAHSRQAITAELERCFQGVPADTAIQVNWSNVEGNQFTSDNPFEQRLVRLAGEKSAPLINDRRQDGEPLEYFDALQFCFETRHWRILLKTADTDDKGEGVFDTFSWLRLLARPYLEEQAALVHERQTAALSICVRPKSTTGAGDNYTAFPRILSIASFLGGQFSIQANGESYFEEPSLAAKAATAAARALRKRPVEIVPTEWVRNHKEQFTLALDLDVAGAYLKDPFGGPLEIATRTAAMARMPNISLKMLPVMFAIAPLSGRWAKGRLIDLAHLLYPDWATGTGAQIKPWKSRRQQKNDLENISNGFICAGKGLQTMEIKPDGTRHPYDLFSVDYDLSSEPDSAIGWMINPWLAERMRGGLAGGYFLLNMSRWLTLGIDNPRLFTLALRLASIHDQHRVNGIYDPNRVRPIRWDELARQCNILPMVSDKRDERSIKSSMRTARAKMEADLNTLQEIGLNGDWGKSKKKIYGEGFEFLPVAPEDYAEACERAVKANRKHRERKSREIGRQK